MGNPAMQQLYNMASHHAAGHRPGGRTPDVPAPSGPVSIDVFLSYSRKDSFAMRQVQDVLRAAGLSVWTDEGLEPGTQGWRIAIYEAIDQARGDGGSSFAERKASRWVNNEIGFAQTLARRALSDPDCGR